MFKDSEPQRITGIAERNDSPCYIHLNVVLVLTAGQGQGACRDVASQWPRHSGVHGCRWAAYTALADWRKDDGDVLRAKNLFGQKDI